MKISAIKTKSRSLLGHQWGGAVVTSLLIFLAVYSLYKLFPLLYPRSYSGVIGIITFIGIFLVLKLLFFMLRAGIFGYFLDNTSVQLPALRRVFSVFIHEPDKYIFAALFLAAVDILCMAPAGIFCLFTSLKTQATLILFFIWLLVGFIALIFFRLTLSQMIPLLLTEDYEGLAQTVRKSALLMKGRRLKLLGLHLSFIGWYLLGLLSSFIGFLWILPYHYQARAVFFRDSCQNV